MSCAIIGLTRESTKKAFWKDILKVIDRDLSLGCKFNESDLSMNFPNGSIISLAGADAKPDDMMKFLGQKFKTIVIDEGSMWRQDISELIYGILRPATADLRGTIMLVGTPSNLTSGLFYELTSTSTAGTRQGWSVHSWDTYANPHMAEQWQEEIDLLIEGNPGIEDTPRFRQMYKKEWVKDIDAQIYKWKDSYAEEPPPAKYFYVLGCDLGWNDATAFVVGAYSLHDNTMYIVHAEKESELIIDDVAKRIQKLDKRYGFDKMIVDGASKQAVETMRQRYSLPLESAEKQGKHEHIDLLNSDLICGSLKVSSGAYSLIDEWKSLIYDERKLRDGTRVEHPSCENHLADAALYAWRYCYAYLSEPIIPIAHPTSEAKVDEFWEQEGDKILNTEETLFWEK